MNINVTLIAQIIAFVVMTWLVNRYLWRPISVLLEQRQARIADGLAAAERGHQQQEQAEQHAEQVLQESRARAGEIIAQAERRAGEIVDEAKAQARIEAERLIEAAHQNIEQETTRARERLRSDVADLAMSAARKILKREIDADAHSAMLNELVARL